MPRRGEARPRLAGAAPAPATRTLEGSVHGDGPGTCRLVFVLAEGLRHIAERRAKAGPRRGTMRVRRPTRMTVRPMPTPRTPSRTRTRRRVRRRAGTPAR